MAERLILDYRDADLPADDRALCDFAVKLTLTPGAMNAGDTECLRQHGLTDEQITVATQVVSYFNYINRVADGLGVDLEPWMTRSPEDWRREKGRFTHPPASHGG
ncbi:MAG: peroxidase [Phycisphaerae bacterium]|nr:peroxidase [Phycisphaerae bacterium]